MKKIIDCFLFFQELDLLEIRLKYLDPYVDYFVIVEACQAFTGADKRFVFEDNESRFSPFLSKIVYYKITDNHVDYDSVISFLKKTDSLLSLKILKIMEELNIPKNDLNWVLDAYHKECIQFPLEKIANDTDIVIYSDLDEIPSKEIFEKDIFALANTGPLVCVQKEFSYFFNYHRIDSEWRGTIFGLKGAMTNRSLNRLRDDAWVLDLITDVVPNGGYHFTSVGSISDIKNKIESWGHQEFNNSKVKDNLEQKILTGQDPFGRKVGTIFQKVSLNNSEFFDSRISSLIKPFSSLIATDEIQEVRPGIFLVIWHKINWFFSRALFKIYKFFGVR